MRICDNDFSLGRYRLPFGASWLILVLLVASCASLPALAIQQSGGRQDSAEGESPSSRHQGELKEPRLRNLSQEALQEEKLRQEILKLQSEVEGQGAWWTTLVRLAPFITAMVGLVGAFIGLWKYLAERKKERLQREAELRQRLDEKFATVTADLGAEAEASRVAAAVTLLTFLNKEYSSLHEQTLMIVVANLRIDHSLSVRRLLTKAFERSIAIVGKRRVEEKRREEMDLSRCRLRSVDLTAVRLEWFEPLDLFHADLSNAVLRGVHLKRARGYGVKLKKAQLSHANLEEARMHKADLSGAYLHNARMVSVKLNEADLRQAQFQQAQLQGARFKNADLRGAHFEEADLADANFRGAQLQKHLDDVALSSLGLAKRWEDAHFEPEVRKRIQELCEGRKRAG